MKKPGIINLSFMLLAILLFTTSCSCLKHTIPSSDENTLTISPDGGEYNFPSGIRLSVPAGAVEEETDISLKLLNHEELQPILNKFGFKEEDLLAYIEGKPNGLTFNTPVELILSSHIEGDDIPLIYDVINDTTCTIGSNSKIKINSENNELIISVSHFSSFFAQIVTKLRDLFNIECLTEPCRCGDKEIIQGDKDFLCDNGDCQISESIVTVIFSECGSTEESVMREISPGCLPKLVLSADSYIVPTGGQTNIEANIKLGCAPQSGLNVDFSRTVTNLATLNPISDNTNSDGSAQTTFIAGDTEGTVSVRAWSEINYYTSTLSANAGGIKEINHGAHISKQLLETTDIHIQDSVESWSGTMSFDTEEKIGVKESAHYDINFQFFVSKEDEYGWRIINGTATSTQTVTLSPYHECYYFKNLSAPPSLNLLIEGNISPNSNNVLLNLRKEDDTKFYNYLQCYSCDPEAPDNCKEGSSMKNLITGRESTSIGTVTGEILLNEGTYSGSLSFITSNQFIYTITLQKDE